MINSCPRYYKIPCQSPFRFYDQKGPRNIGSNWQQTPELDIGSDRPGFDAVASASHVTSCSIGWQPCSLVPRHGPGETFDWPRPTSAPSSRDARARDAPSDVGGRYRQPATASARSVSLARSPPGRGASGRGCHSSCSPDVFEGETRPRDEALTRLRDEDLRRVGQDYCRGRHRRAKSEVGCALNGFLHQAYAPARADLFLLRSREPSRAEVLRRVRGHAVAPGETRRRLVTALFCDLVGSTELGERLDPEILRKVLDRYFDAMRAAIQRHGGTVEKFIGDAVVGAFGVPEAHEDDALRAVRAALEMREAAAELDAEIDDPEVRIRVRIAIDCGEAFADEAAATEGSDRGRRVQHGRSPSGGCRAGRRAGLRGG